MDARVGGTFKMSFQNFSTRNGHSFGGEYRELVPGAGFKNLSFGIGMAPTIHDGVARVGQCSAHPKDCC